MEETEYKKMQEEELNFLKEELKRIDNVIKVIIYGGDKDFVEAQIKLWELREKIKEKIDNEFMKSNQTGKYKPKRKGSFMGA